VTTRQAAYGEHGLTPVDRLGVWLSLRAVRRVVDWSARPDVVDLGCGYEAALLRALAPRIGSGVGVDVSVSPRADGVPGLSFVRDRVERALPALPAASADVVLAISVLEHLWEPLEALREAHRLLRPGGVLVVNVPTWRGKRALELSAFRLGLSPAQEMDDHKAYYDLRDLWPLLVRAGFRPSALRVRRHKLGLNLLAVGVRGG